MLQLNRVGVLIDGSNFYQTARAIGLSVDYASLLVWLKKQGKLKRSPLYFTALRKEYEDTTIKPLIDWLKYNGYCVVTKETKEFIDSDGIRKTKGNMDGEMIVHGMLMGPHIDVLYLFSGDGDFTFMVKTLQEYFAVKVVVVSSIKPNFTTDALRSQCDEFIELQSIAEFIQQPPRELIKQEARNVYPRRRA